MIGALMIFVAGAAMLYSAIVINQMGCRIFKDMISSASKSTYTTVGNGDRCQLSDKKVGAAVSLSLRM